jgi:hypothetical protein
MLGPLIVVLLFARHAQSYLAEKKKAEQRN